jgi:hypothetical protein
MRVALKFSQTTGLRAGFGSRRNSLTPKTQIMVQANTFSISDVIGPVKGFHDPSITWNGWECPYFELDAVQQIIKHFTSEPSEQSTFEWKEDTLTYYDLYSPFEECEVFEPSTIDVNGNEIKVWAVGAFMWVWELANETANN